MGMGLLFWILMILWFIFGLLWSLPGTTARFGPYGPVGNTLLLFVLFLLLGWKTFGPPLH